MINLNKGTELKKENIMLSVKEIEALNKAYPEIKKVALILVDIFFSDFRVADYKWTLKKDHRNKKYASFFSGIYEQTKESYRKDIRFIKMLGFKFNDLPSGDIEEFTGYIPELDLKALVLLILNAEVYDPNFEKLTKDNFESEVQAYPNVINYFDGFKNPTIDLVKLLEFLDLVFEFDMCLV